MEVKYSFVLPAYKKRYLKYAIDSILAQTYKSFELVVVNDASPEDLDSILNLYNDKRIRYYVNKTNIGGKDLVAQWNHSISYATGKYLILASDDDLYFPDYLEKMNYLIDKYPNVNVFRPRVQYIDAEDKTIGVESVLKEYITNSEYLYSRLKEWIYSGIPYYIFRLDKLKSLGGFQYYPLAWYCDDDIVLRTSKEGIVSSNEILFSFRLSGESISTRKDSIYDIKSKISSVNRYFVFLSKYINDLSTNKDDVSNFYKSFICKSINNKLRNNHISCILHTISYIDLLRITLFLLKCPTIGIKELVLLHIKYIKNICKRSN